MDPPHQAFHALDKPSLTFNERDRERDGDALSRSGSLKRKTTHPSRNVPTTPADMPSDTSTASQEPYGSSRTTTPPQAPHLSRQNSGLPPTPPTMTNSDVAESKPHRTPSPAPRFADRLRNALEQQKSGLSTPEVESQSPPTPDPSPPSNAAHLDAPRPDLPHYASSYAESFKTAHDGQSIHDGTPDLLPEDMTPRQHKRLNQHSWLDTNRALGLSNMRLAVQEVEPSQHVDSDVEEPRPKSYHIDPDSDVEHSLERNYLASNETSSIEESPVSPTLRKSLNHTPVKRLWKPLQPGDEIKRPDQALLYGTSSLKWKPRAKRETPPAREMDTEFLRNAVLESERPDQAQRKTIEESEKNNASTLTALPSLPPEEQRAMSPPTRADIANKLKEMSQSSQPIQKSPSKSPSNPQKLPEFMPAEAPVHVLSPPTTAQKKSLEENNKVYKLIREENAKRHSAISDGSVQAMITPIPEHKRKLRHTPKRDSLRADVSIVDSKRGSEDSSAQKLRHKRGMDSLGSVELAKSIERSKDPAPKTPSAPISRFDSGENGFDYWSGLPAIGSKVRAVASAKVLGSPHKLRRAMREHSLDKAPRSVSDSAARPSSMGSNAISEEASPLPHLRRSSADHRLENNLEVRRASLTRDAQGMSYPVEVKMEKIGEELTLEGRRELYEVREERTPHRRASSVKTTATSPQRRSFDIRHLHPTATPFSTSQWSGTEAEVCEAKGIELYPHNNESLLLVQSGSRLISKPAQIDEDLREASNESEPDAAPGAQEVVFHAFVDAPSESTNDIGNANYTVDSPLTNPRAAPEPPVIKFIPPTPNHELERELGASTNETAPLDDPNKKMPSPSLSQRVRRYSESLVQPFPFGRNGSVRRQNSKRRQQRPVTEVRPTHLSSFWQPRDFWEEYDSDDGENEDYEPLPSGGDTSNIEAKRTSRFLSRNMSVRMPGFRGTGGFLQGNSLGIDRHGTNVRRHYIDKSGPHIVKSRSGSNLNLNTRSSEEMLRRLAERKRRRTFTLPFSGGAKVEYVGLGVLSARMRERRQRKHDRALEKRREKLRGQIGTRVYHDGGRCEVGLVNSQ